ncbi:HTH_Tnp_Tc3_2 domain-containing protein [Trichonephila clavipes]|nr:HTH_Tnp_Tc3_2 domain-containing protein [Trichonephila clavipes]
MAEIWAAVNTTVTQKTVKNQLLQGHLQARHPVVYISKTPNDCRLRRQWCQSRAHSRKDLESIEFSDESSCL